MKFSIYFLSLTFFFGGVLTNTFATEQSEAEYKTMEQMMGSIRLEKKQIEGMLDKMIVSGRISREEGTKAKREIASIKESDLELIKTRAIAEIKSKRLQDH